MSQKSYEWLSETCGPIYTIYQMVHTQAGTTDFLRSGIVLDTEPDSDNKGLNVGVIIIPGVKELKNTSIYLSGYLTV